MQRRRQKDSAQFMVVIEIEPGTSASGMKPSLLIMLSPQPPRLRFIPNTRSFVH